MVGGPHTGHLTVINVPKLHALRAKVPCPANRGPFLKGVVGQSLKIALRAFREGDSPKFVDAEGCATRILRVTVMVDAALAGASTMERSYKPQGYSSLSPYTTSTDLSTDLA